MIIYLHGFRSGPQSFKAQTMQAHMAARGLAEQFICPALPFDPAAAIELIETLIANALSAGRRLTLVGSSLVGHYANFLAEKYDLKAVLVNPAAVDRLNVDKFIGEHANFHSGERFTFSPAHAAQLKAQVTPPTLARYWLMVESADEVLDYRQALEFYAGCRQTVLPGGDHSFTKFPDFVPQIIEFAGL